MKPESSPCEDNQSDLFKTELVEIIDLTHPLVQLARAVDWATLEAAFTPLFCSDNGSPAKSVRLMTALHYLKYSYDLSDEDVVSGWVENPYWQYLSGMKYFEHEVPIDPSSMTRWRNRLGEAGAEQMLRETIEAGLRLKAVKKSQLRRVNVDTTVQEKDVRFPTDARLYDRSRERLVAAAGERGIVLRQTYSRLGKQALLQSSRYAHARQMKRSRRCTKKLRTWLGRVIRDIERKCPDPDPVLSELLSTSRRIHAQQRHDKNKVYSVHETHVECNDGHTLASAMDQLERLGIVPDSVYVDRGYRGHNYGGPTQVHVDKKRRGHTAKALWRWMKRRAAIEPGIGHLKQEHRMDRCRLKGVEGDCFNAILSAAGMNFRKLIAHVAVFLRFFFEFIQTPPDHRDRTNLATLLS